MLLWTQESKLRFKDSRRKRKRRKRRSEKMSSEKHLRIPPLRKRKVPKWRDLNLLQRE